MADEEVQLSLEAIRRIIAAVRKVEAMATGEGQTSYGNAPVLARFPARITAVSGSFPKWSYTVQRVTTKDTTLTSFNQWKTFTTNLTAENTCEFAPPAGTYPYTYGTGNLISSNDGTVSGVTCKIRAIGVGAVVDITQHMDQTGHAVYRFFAPNSAQ